jgi:hypothetical protein
MRTIVNMTPHPIHFLDENGEIKRTFPPEGLARLKAVTVDTGISIDGCRVTTTEFGTPEGLPAEELVNLTGSNADELDGGEIGPKTYYIVSQLIKSANPNRLDLLVPAEVVRDAEGRILGCRSFGI